MSAMRSPLNLSVCILLYHTIMLPQPDKRPALPKQPRLS